MKLRIIFISLVLLLIPLILAYNYQINIDSNYAVFNTSVYKCTDSGCSNITFHSSSTTGEFSLVDSGSNYYAEYDYLHDYLLCFKPHIYRIHAWGDLSGTENYNIVFNKKENCQGAINNGELSEYNITLGESVTITANVHSGFEYPDGIPETTAIPDDIKDEYSTNTNVSIYANGIKINETTAEILLASDKDFSFDWTPSSAGIYNITAKSEIIDCACSSQETQEFFIGILIVNEPSECSTDTNCTADYYSNNSCSNNDVYKDYHDFSCLIGFCNENITEILVEDCGEDYCDDWGEYFCEGKNKTRTRTCYDKGCSSGSCFNNSNIQKQSETCNYNCSNGTCTQPVCGNYILELGEECDDGNLNNFDGCDANCRIERECCDDGDCPNDTYSNNYCYNNNVWRNLTDYSCINSSCVFDITPQEDINCGEDEYGNWSNYCQGDDMHRQRYYAHHGCSNGECFVGTVIQHEFVETCAYDCVNGTCTQPICGNNILEQGEECDDGNTVNGDGCNSNCRFEIFCNNNSDCGTDGWLNQDYCVCTTNVWDFWKIYECENPGTSQSYCTNRTEIRLKQECGNSSCGNWQNYCYDNDIYKNKTCYDVGCSFGACFNNSIVNTTFVQDCGNDSCDAPINYCENNDVWKNQTCYDRGCLSGGCFNNPFTNKSLFEDCGSDSYGTWNYYCKGKEVWKNKTDILRGCSNALCFTNNSYKNENVSVCEYDCINGSCVDECDEDSDCSDGIFCNGQEKCITGKCENGTNVDCHGFDLCPIGECNYTNDGNPFTWDYFPGFISICDENTNSCTIGYLNITHACDFDCDAQCIENSDCPEKCTQISHKLYNFLGCNESCKCEYSGSYKCVIGKCGAVCDSDDDCTCPIDTCNGTTLYNYPENSTCGTSGSQGCLCAQCTANITYNSTQCGYVEGFCGDGIINNGEECDLGINNNVSCTPLYGESCTYCSDVCENITLTDGYCGDGHLDVGHEQCENNSDCADPICEDRCIGDDYYEYEATENDCNACSCEDNECEIKNISYNNSRCLQPFCGDGTVNLLEQCELPDTEDNLYCSQSIQKCSGNKLGVRDGFGFCDLSCGCVEDNFVYNCVIGQCDAQCVVNNDCDDSNEHTKDTCDNCICEHETLPYCGDGHLDSGEQCDDGNLINGDGCDKFCKKEGFPPLVWMCDSRAVLDDSVEPGTTPGENLTERQQNYAFEGESIKWKVLVMDKNGINKVEDVYGTVGYENPGAGNPIEVNCVEDLNTTRILDSCNARIGEENITAFNPTVMRYYTCTLTIEPDMYGDAWITVEATDLDGLTGTMDENEYWFLNPVIALTIKGDIKFDNAKPGTSSYSDTLLVGNDADQGSGVSLEMYIAGTDFYDSSSSGAMCPYTNQLNLNGPDAIPGTSDDALRYFATNGFYSTKDVSGVNPIYNPDAEGYVAIPHGERITQAKEIIGTEIYTGKIKNNIGNVLTPGSEMALTFRLDLPEPCNGDFDTGNIYFWGEAI